MKVKDIAEFLNIDSSKVLDAISLFVFDDNYNEDSEVDKVLEKKLAKRFNVSGFKAKKVVAPKQPEVKVETKGDVKKVEEKKIVEIKKAEPKPNPVNNKPKDNKNNNVNHANNANSASIANNKPNQNNKPKDNNVNKANNTNKPNQQNNKPKDNKVNNVNNVNNVNKVNNVNNVNNANTNNFNNQKKASKPVYQEENLSLNEEDEEVINKYGDMYSGDRYEGQKNVRIKKKVKTNENIKQKKAKPQKSRAEKLAGEREIKKEENVLYYEPNMTTSDVADELGISVTELVKKLFMSMGVMASATQSLDRDTIELIAMEYNFEVKNKQIADMIRFDEMVIEDKEEDLVPRPPIVTIMGHVDHGKTTLLDTIRSSHVVKGEAGGITQHIGAYQVMKDNRLITFIDTPGHAAFTEMRARGAQVTDIVILVVAADDGVMPQTKEAIEHAQAANVPIIVAVNKMDKPGANSERIKQELTTYNLIPEDWGGDTIYVEISALTGKGVDELLEMVLLLADMKEYKANPNRQAVGTVIEARLDKGRGSVATLLVESGTLKVGDMIVVGITYGKVRAMQDELGRIIKTAGPSKPVEITGLTDVPFAGEKFMALEDEKKARAIAEVRAQNKFNEEMGAMRATSLNDILQNENGEVKNLNLIIKCDVQGSIEAIKGLVDKIEIEGIKVNIISSRVGGITENDISLAIASHAIIVGFNIRPTSQISDFAKEKNVEIRLYNIIYKLQEDIEKAAKGLLDPVLEEHVTGEAEVRELFKISKVGTVAGSMVTKGELKRNGSVRVIRDSIVVYTGKIAGLRRFKDDVKEVKEGYDCGITVENFNDLKVGDRLECFVMEEAERD